MPRIWISALCMPLVVSTACSGASRIPATPLEGAWLVVQRSYVRGDSSWVEADPQPGIYVFGREYYGVQEIRESGARPPFTEVTSNAERLAAFEVFHAHSGTYAVTDSTITISPLVAKGPNTMSGRAATYTYVLDGDRLAVTRTSVAERETRTTRLVRVE